MDWKDVARVVAPIAPTLGGLLGGLIPFPGGALAGQALGNIIAGQFGVPSTPDAVHAAIVGSPNEVAIAKLQAATDEAKSRWPAIAEIEAARELTDRTFIEQVNATARAELQSESLFKSGWRPFIGWVLGAEIAAVGAALVLALFSAIVSGKTETLNVLVGALPAICLFLALPAACVGVTIWTRQRDKLDASPAVPVPALPVAPKPAAAGKK